VTIQSMRPPRVEIPADAWYGGQLSSFVARLAVEHGPIFTFVPEAGPHASQGVVYMVGPEANRFVLLTHREHFSHDLGWTPVIGDTLGHGLLNMDPPEHTRHRALMNPAFTAAFMDRYLPLMQRVIAQRTRHWLTEDSVDVLSEAREITFDVAAAALVGFETGAQVDWLRERFYALLHMPDVEEDQWELVIQRQLQIRDELQRMLLELIDARRRAAPTEQPGDVLGMLVRARDEHGQPLTDEQLLAHVNILLVAGHETTTTLGAWLLYLLATHPDYGARVDAELASTLGGVDVPLTSETVRSLPLLASAVREAGRLQSPVLLLPRGVVSPFAFGGYSVAAGTPLFLAIAAGHRLPTVFASPDVFDPDRFLPPREEDRKNPYALATFGGGPRICLGINFAHVEAMALAAHVRRFCRLEAIPGLAIEQIGGIVQSLPHGIRVRVRPRNSH
jgi:retinoid hydroxylase